MYKITTADNTDLYVKDWGTGQPVILLAGWPLSSDSWDDQTMALAEAGHRVISYDRRWFGRSSQPWSGYDYDTLADDLAAVIKQLAIDDVILVGFSMGGGEVARYMSRHGGKSVSKAVLISSVVPGMLKSPDNPFGIDISDFYKMSQEINADRAKFFTGFFNTFFGVGLIAQPVSNELIDWARNMAMQASLKATLACMHSFSTTDFNADLATFNVPTMVIHGSDDKIVPIEIGFAAAKAIANSTFVGYENAPHGLFATDKDQLSRDLLYFFHSPKD